MQTFNEIGVISAFVYMLYDNETIYANIIEELMQNDNIYSNTENVTFNNKTMTAQQIQHDINNMSSNEINNLLQKTHRSIDPIYLNLLENPQNIEYPSKSGQGRWIVENLQF